VLATAASCPACGAKTTEAQKFCGECGTPVRPVSGTSDPLRAELAAALGATYELDRLLGRGGMGAVYLARERALDRLCAVKVLPPEIAGSEESRERFRREARTAARLTHQNIVPLYTFGETAGLVFYVMGYVRGQSVAERLRQRGPLRPDEVQRILVELASALEYAHANGVVHRDIKPDNILLDADTGRPMLADFGIAKAAASGATLTVEGAIVGTPQYMSPEQASGDRAIDGRSDLYSLGLLGWAMLSGRPPFEGDPRDVIIQHVTRPLPALAVSDVPETLAHAVRRCLEKDPADRWQNAAELARALSSQEVEEDALSDELQMLQGSGHVTIATTLALGVGSFYFYFFPPANDGGVPFWSVLAGVAILSPLMVLAQRHSVEKRGVRGLAAWRLIFHLSDWMTHLAIWPRWMRRPGDVWHRLPSPIRFGRRLLTFGYLTAIIGMPLSLIFRNSDKWDPEPRWIPSERIYVGGWSTYQRAAAELAIPVGYMLGFFGAFGTALAYGHRRGLNWNDSAKLIAAPTRGISFWRRPHIAAHLESGEAGNVAAQPRAAFDYQRAIAELARDVPASHQVLASEVASAARAAADAVTSLERRVAELERDFDSAELERVDARLKELDRASDSDTITMRSLLSGQLELMKKIRARLDEARARKERITESLRLLWLQMTDLRAAALRDADAASEITGQLRSVCSEMQRQLASGDEAAALLRDASRHADQ
jgi:hypothetical protein